MNMYKVENSTICILSLHICVVIHTICWILLYISLYIITCNDMHSKYSTCDVQFDCSIAINNLFR